MVSVMGLLPASTDQMPMPLWDSLVGAAIGDQAVANSFKVEFTNQ